MRLIKSALCILVILALAVSIVPTSASASSLAVVGTTLSSAGMTSAEFAAAAGPYAIGILAAVAAAFGIKSYVQENTGQAVKDNFMELIRQRATDMRRSEAEEMEALLSNATIGEQGNIVLGRLSFAEAKAILLREEIPAVRPNALRGIYLKNYKFVNSLDYVFYNYNFADGGYRYVMYCESKDDPINNMFFVNSDNYVPQIMFKEGSVTGTYLDWYVEDIVTGNIVYTGRDGINHWKGPFKIGTDNYYISLVGYEFYRNPYVPMNSVTNIISKNYSLDDLSIDYSPDTLYGVDETLRDQNVGLYEGLNLAPDLINSAVLGGAAGQITASDYCGALVDYVSGYDTVIDGVTVTGLPEAATVPRSIDEAPTSETVIDEAPPSTMTGTEAAGLYAFSLDELFPFCLPFDFVKIIEKFDVEPEAPNFDWRFYIPGVIDYTLHIDLSAWNTAAEVCRTMVLIAFMVGLIMLTRQIFIRA